MRILRFSFRPMNPPKPVEQPWLRNIASLREACAPNMLRHRDDREEHTEMNFPKPPGPKIVNIHGEELHS